MAGLAFLGMTAFPFLPVAPLPQIDFPTVLVTATLSGASAETMASSVAAPLERQFAQIAGVTEMTSFSGLGATSVTIQFDLNRNIDAAAQDVQAAITAAGKTLPQSMTSPPTYKKLNPADAPILMLSARSDTLPITVVDEYAGQFSRPADRASSGCGPGFPRRRTEAGDPRPGGPGQARRKRSHARRDSQCPGRLDDQRRQRHADRRKDELHDRRQRSTHRSRAI